MKWSDFARTIPLTSSLDPARLPMASSARMFGWTLGLLSVGLLSMVLYLGDLVCTGLYYARIQNSLEQHFGSVSDPKVLLGHPELAALPQTTNFRLRKAIDILSLLREDHPEQAESQLKESSLPALNLRRKLEEKLGAIIEKDEVLNRLNEEKLVRRTHMQALAEKYHGLAEDFAVLIGYSIPQETEEALDSETLAVMLANNKPDSLTSYTTGIFQGLPLLTGLPDGLSNPQSAAKYVSKTSGPRITTSLMDPHSNIHVRLGSIKEQTSRVITQHSRWMGEFNEINEGSNLELEERSQHKKDALRMARTLLTQLVWPDIDTRILVAYSHFREIAAGHGHDFPELKSSDAPLPLWGL